MIRIACCQYQIESLSNWESYSLKIENLVREARNAGANILVMPEYAGTEISCKRFDTDEGLYLALMTLLPKYLDLYVRLAKTYKIYIQAGTIIEQISSNKFVNRAWFFNPDGSYEYQDKLQLTTYEKKSNLFLHGKHQKIFETPFAKIGIAVCYDSEFPEIIRQLVKNGASIILVPSYTSTVAGYHRVSLSCRARAIENQCYVATSFVINKYALSSQIEETYGSAMIIGPADLGFPDDGIISQGIMNKPMLITGDVSLEAIELVRKHGQVHNYEDTARYEETFTPLIKTIQF